MLHVCVHKKGPPSFSLGTITLESCGDVQNLYFILAMSSNEGSVGVLGCSVREC